jgi:hypothetical protein
MGCQGFIGRIPSTFPDKYTAEAEVFKNDATKVSKLMMNEE